MELCVLFVSYKLFITVSRKTIRHFFLIFVDQIRSLDKENRAFNTQFISIINDILNKESSHHILENSIAFL